MDTLRAMFPDLDSQTLQATLEAHNNSVERTVDYLLSAANEPTTNSDSDHARRLQEEQDAEMAHRLQAEQDAYDGAEVRQPREPVPNPGLPIPSMNDVQNAVKPIVDGVQYAGRVAAESVQSLYREFMGEGEPSNRPAYNRRTNDDPVVLRGEAASPSAARATTRQRRPVTGSYGGYGGKKDA